MPPKVFLGPWEFGVQVDGGGDESEILAVSMLVLNA